MSWSWDDHLLKVSILFLLCLIIEWIWSPLSSVTVSTRNLAAVPGGSFFAIYYRRQEGSASVCFQSLMDKSDVCSSAGMPTRRHLQSDREIQPDRIWPSSQHSTPDSSNTDTMNSKQLFQKALIEVRAQIRTTSVFQGCGNIWHNNFGFLIVVHGFQNRCGFAVLWLHFARKLDSLQQFFNLFLGTLYKNCRLILFMSPLMMI